MAHHGIMTRVVSNNNIAFQMSSGRAAAPTPQRRPNFTCRTLPARNNGMAVQNNNYYHGLIIMALPLLMGGDALALQGCSLINRHWERAQYGGARSLMGQAHMNQSGSSSSR